MSAFVENEAHLFESTMPALLQEEDDPLTYSGHSSQRQSTDSESIKTNASSSFPLVTPPALEDEDVPSPLLSHGIEIVDLENETIKKISEPLDKKSSSFVKRLQRKPSVSLLSSKSTRAADSIKQKLTPVAHSETMVLQPSKSLHQQKRSTATNQQVDTFLAFLRSSAATTYKKVATSSTDLVRSRSKRTWSIQLKPSTSTSSTSSTSSHHNNNQKRSSSSSHSHSNSHSNNSSHQHTHTNPPKKTHILYQLDPTIILSNPPRQQTKTETEKSLSFVHALHETMTQGGYLSPNLYVPMDLWYQSNVRIPAIDTKIMACQELIQQLEEMTQCDLSNPSSIQSSLTLLEKSLANTNKTMKRKLGGLASNKMMMSRTSSIRTTPTVTKMTKMYGFDDHGSNSSINSLLNQHGIAANTSSSIQPSPLSNTKSLESIVEGATAGLRNSPQAITAWGSKLSKSVEKMNQRNSYHDQNEVYIKSLVQLFSMADILDKWKVDLEDKDSVTLIQISQCAELFCTVVCGFVMKDYEILLEKWLKQSSEWLLN